MSFNPASTSTQLVPANSSSSFPSSSSSSSTVPVSASPSSTRPRAEMAANQRGGNYRRTPLMAACREGHVDVAAYLLDHSARINAQDTYGYTALCECQASAEVDDTHIFLKKNVFFTFSIFTMWCFMGICLCVSHLLI